VLAVNGAVFGGFLAYSLQRASNSTDPRVLYPLLALGTGLGVGAAMLVGDEWDFSTGDAWFLSAGAWWGAASGVLVATGQNAATSNQFAYGVGTGLGGIALATFALTRSRMDEGDALLAHSGGALGFFVGGLVDLAYRGTTNVTPYTGAGYGSAIGVVGAGALATVVQVQPSRVILIDTGAAIGALAGAAAGSPLVFQNVTDTKNRLFLASTLGGTVIGGAVAWWMTRDSKPRDAAASLRTAGGGAARSREASIERGNLSRSRLAHARAMCSRTNGTSRRFTSSGFSMALMWPEPSIHSSFASRIFAASARLLAGGVEASSRPHTTSVGHATPRSFGVQSVRWTVTASAARAMPSRG
jgi:hypothetical protein